MYDYTFEYLGKKNDVSDEYIDKQINVAQVALIQQLEITQDSIGKRTQSSNVTYDGKSGSRIEYLISKDEKKLQWLIIFYNTDRSYFKVTSEVYLGQD